MLQGRRTGRKKSVLTFFPDPLRRNEGRSGRKKSERSRCGDTQPRVAAFSFFFFFFFTRAGVSAFVSCPLFLFFFSLEGDTLSVALMRNTRSPFLGDGSFAARRCFRSRSPVFVTRSRYGRRSFCRRFGDE